MCLKREMKKYTENYWADIENIKEKLKEAEAILVGIGAGMSTAAGLSYSGKRFQKYFSDFRAKYGIKDMYTGGFYPFSSLEEYWAWWSRHIYYNRYDTSVGEPYKILLELMKDKNYFILTTNVDHQIQKAGFDKNKLFYMQGDYGLWQCSKPCHNKTYDNEEQVKTMIANQRNMKIKSELIPYCPNCSAPMTMNLRIDDKFVQDEGWYRARNNYENFLNENKNKKIVFLELGVGRNTPGIIKYPFIQLTYQNKNASYIVINLDKEFIIEEIKNQSIKITKDISQVLKDILFS